MAFISSFESYLSALDRSTFIDYIDVRVHLRETQTRQVRLPKTTESEREIGFEPFAGERGKINQSTPMNDRRDRNLRHRRCHRRLGIRYLSGRRLFAGLGTRIELAIGSTRTLFARVHNFQHKFDCRYDNSPLTYLAGKGPNHRA